jgi:hypothetical protein
MNDILQKLNVIQTIRRNHALEHATITILRRKGELGALGGISGLKGFWLLGDIDPTTLQEAVDEALQRLKAGEKHLAIQQQCGSNYAIPGMLAGFAAWLIMIMPGKKNLKTQFNRLTMVMLAVTMVTIFAAPLGPVAQQLFLTDADMGDMRVAGIMLYDRHGHQFQHVITQQ